MTVYEQEKPSVMAFVIETAQESETGYVYIQDLYTLYKSWRQVAGMPATKLTLKSFACALPDRYPRKFINRGRSSIGKGPARAVMGICVRH